MDRINLPAGIGEMLLDIVHQCNGGDEEIQIIIIAAKTGTPPSVVSSIHPDMVPQVLQWLIDHHDNADFKAEYGTLN
jgi:hypothetical protein